MVRNTVANRSIFVLLGVVLAWGQTATTSGAVEMADSMGASTGRKPGSSLGGQKLETGPGTWSVDGSIVGGDDGVTSARPAGGTAFHAIPPAVGIHSITAEICPAGLETCGALAFFKSNPAGKFFSAAELSFVYSQNGGYAIQVKGLGEIKHGSKADYPGFKPDGFNKLELSFDSQAGTVSAKINGGSVLDQVALKGQPNVSLYLYAGFRLNGPLKPNAARVRNYSVSVTPLVSAGLVPIDVGECFFDPKSNATLRFKLESIVPGQTVPFAISDYEGKEVSNGNADVDAAGEVVVPANLARGYYDLRFPASRESFGLVALERTEHGDPFFCMDSSLSWLELDPQRRDALVKILARCGMAMSRERLGLGAVNPVKDKFKWDGGSRGFESVRKTYADAKVPVLELLDGRAAQHGVIPESPYPQDLPELSASWTEVARHWQETWGGAEVCNEPDLKELPADQYVINAKAMSYALSEARSTTPLVTGVFATMPPGPFFDACVANGMLADSNAVSIHSYDHATDIQAMVQRYRAWLKQAGAEAMPLWHSECGWSWANGPARPPLDQDQISALEISAKAMESRACGIARHFPFVYVYYEEGQKNFGMMGREATPLRSMAAYAVCANTLAGRAYLGDLKVSGPEVKLARVFSGRSGGECVAVLYTGKVDAHASLSIPVRAKHISGIDGRDLPSDDGRVPVPDGMAYAWFDPADLGPALITDAPAARLFEIGQHPLETRRLASPVVLQFLASKTPSRVSSRHYLVTQDLARGLPLNVRVHNLGKSPVQVSAQLQLPGSPPGETRSVTVAAMSSGDLAWKIDATPFLDIAATRFVTIKATVSTGVAPSPLAIPVIMSGTLEEHLRRYPRQRPLPISDLKRWSTNIAGHGKSKFSAGADGWRMDVTFTGTSGNWAYPKFTLPEKLDPAADSGFLIRARVVKPAANLAILAIPRVPGGIGFWATDLFPADGEWHVVYVPFGEFKPGPNQAGNQNARLDPGSWQTLAIGMGSQAADNAIEVSHFLVVGGAE